MTESSTAVFPNKCSRLKLHQLEVRGLLACRNVFKMKMFNENVDLWNFKNDFIAKVFFFAWKRIHAPVHSLALKLLHFYTSTHTRPVSFFRSLMTANTRKCHEVEKIKRRGASSPPVLITLLQVAS